MGFSGSARGKEPVANAGDVRDRDWIPGSGRSPGGGHGKPTPTDRGAWRAAVHGVTKSWTGLKRVSRHAQDV